MRKQIVILSPRDVKQTLSEIPFRVTTTILDPWYNKGVGGFREDYIGWLSSIVSLASNCSDHIFVWGFPEIVHNILDNLPDGIDLVAWLTWYYKNCPSVIRGWRSSQLACLHLSKTGAKLYSEHFLNEKQLDLRRSGKLRYMPGPTSVIEAPLSIGFVSRKEQTGHPAQKPVKVFEPLIMMTTQPGNIVLDPMCGSGTTGEVCMKLGRKAILCDNDERWIQVTENRLGVTRVDSIES